MKEKVIVGLSGGVDSSVSAYLLKKEYDVIGVHLILCSDDPEKENQAIADGRSVAEKLDIPFYTLDAQGEFKEKVIDYFIKAYEEGRTPNPCVECNRVMKWSKLFDFADKMGAKYVATGHYGHVKELPNGRLTIKMAEHQRKDQSYVLYQLSQEELSRILLPLGSYDKKEVRAIAEEIGLGLAQKPDSQDICFISDGDYGAYIESHASPSRPGNFVNLKGEVLGQHKGIIHYTVGQRKGLGRALGYPAYVLEIRPETNEVVVGASEEGLHNGILVDNLNFPAEEEFLEGKRVLVRIRYNHKGTYGTLHSKGEHALEVKLEEGLRGITPGQSAVFYDDQTLYGGGKIVKSLDL